MTTAFIAVFFFVILAQPRVIKADGWWPFRRNGSPTVDPFVDVSENKVIFGSDGDCLGKEDGVEGIAFRLSAGLRLLEGDPTKCVPVSEGGAGCALFGNRRGLQQNNKLRILFGPTDQCSIGVGPEEGSGIQVLDPFGLRVLVPDTSTSSPRIRFGPTDQCSIGVGPEVGSGIQVLDPFGLRVLVPDTSTSSPRIRFGPTYQCSIGVGPEVGSGIQVLDPFGLRVLVPETSTNSPALTFGPTNDCRISAVPGKGMMFDDPAGFVSPCMRTSELGDA
jgi:hypothetical protein